MSYSGIVSRDVEKKTETEEVHVVLVMLAFVIITAVQPNPELKLHPGSVSDLEVSHETEDVKRHVCYLPGVTVTIPDW